MPVEAWGPAAVTAAALFALAGVALGLIVNRIHALEARIDQAAANNRKLWFYTRRLLDLYYRHRQDGAPDPEPLPELKEG